jgi:hypothetical protein
VYNKKIHFCTECGRNLSDVEATTLTQNSEKDSLVDSLMAQVQGLGQKTKGITGVSSIILDKATNVSKGTDNAIVQQKVAESMTGLVNMMLKVSNEVKKGIETDMVNAVILSARVNFVAFSIGASVNLAQLKKSRQEKKS